MRNIFARQSRPKPEAVFAAGSPAARVRADDPRNVDSELLPAEYSGAASTDTDARPDREVDLVELVSARYKDSALHRRSVEREWVLSCAMAEGRQWLGWDDATHRAVSLMDADVPDRYVTHNLTRPLLAKVIALATMTKPDASPAPDGDSDADRAAASEARVICAHLASQNGGTGQTSEVATWAALAGVGYVKHYWDPKALADIPSFGPNGQMAGRKSAPIGEEREAVIPPFEVFIDPMAKRWGDANWVIHGCVKPLSYFVETYGKVGKLVEPDTKDCYGGYVEGYVTDAYGGASQLKDWFGTGTQRKAALCLEMWERPSPVYPDGRLIVVAGKRLMHSGPWPLKSTRAGRDRFPFARLTFQEAVGHCYGQGLVKDIAPLQIGLNRLISRAIERTEQDKLTVMIAKGSGVGSDAYETDEGRTVRKMYYDAIEGAPPTWQPAPPLSADTWRLIDLVWLHMQHIAGIHDVNQGGTPPGVTAGVSIDLLQQGDKTQLGQFTGNIEQFAVEQGELRIALYAQFVSPHLPRLMGLDDSGNPQTARRRAVAFRALTGGGACAMYVTPGSATPKSAAGEQQEVLDFLKLGLFGPPGTPQAALIAVKLLSMARSDMVLDMLQEQIREQKANDPGPAAIQAMKNQAQQEQLQTQLQAQEQSQQLDQQHEAQMASITEQVQAQRDQAVHDRETARVWLDKTVPTISGTMDPVAVVDLERRLGLAGRVPPTPTRPPSSEQ